MGTGETFGDSRGRGMRWEDMEGLLLLWFIGFVGPPGQAQSTIMAGTPPRLTTSGRPVAAIRPMAKLVTWR